MEETNEWTTKIWRFENAEGQGPYKDKRSIIYDDRHVERYWYDDRCPGPWTDRMLARAIDRQMEIERDFNLKAWKFGFHHRWQARRWFWGIMGKLERQGFKLKQVEAREVLYGETQVMFKEVNQT